MVGFTSLDSAITGTISRFHNFAKNIETAHLGNLYTTVIDGIDYYVVECAAKPILSKAPEWISQNRFVSTILNHKGLSILAGGILTLLIGIWLRPKEDSPKEDIVTCYEEKIDQGKKYMVFPEDKDIRESLKEVKNLDSQIIENRKNIGTAERSLLFLDIDGVLNGFAVAPSLLNNKYFISIDLLPKIKEVVEKTNALIVLSSTWRYSPHARNYVYTALETVGIHERIIGCTISVKMADKCKEILPWLANNTNYPLGGFKPEELEILPITGDEDGSLTQLKPPIKCVSFVILDDVDILKNEPGRRFIENNFVQTNGKLGISSTDVENAIKILQPVEIV